MNHYFLTWIRQIIIYRHERYTQLMLLVITALCQKQFVFYPILNDNYRIKAGVAVGRKLAERP